MFSEWHCSVLDKHYENMWGKLGLPGKGVKIDMGESRNEGREVLLVPK